MRVRPGHRVHRTRLAVGAGLAAVLLGACSLPERPGGQGDPERILLWTQVITGAELDEYGQVRILDANTWQQRRRRLQELGGPPQN